VSLGIFVANPGLVVELCLVLRVSPTESLVFQYNHRHLVTPHEDVEVVVLLLLLLLLLWHRRLGHVMWVTSLGAGGGRGGFPGGPG